MLLLCRGKPVAIQRVTRPFRVVGETLTRTKIPLLSEMALVAAIVAPLKGTATLFLGDSSCAPRTQRHFLQFSEKKCVSFIGCSIGAHPPRRSRSARFQSCQFRSLLFRVPSSFHPHAQYPHHVKSCVYYPRFACKAQKHPLWRHE